MTKSPRNRAFSKSFSRIMCETMSTSAFSRTAVHPRERKLQQLSVQGAVFRSPSGQTPWSASFRIASAYFGSLRFASIALRDPSRARCPTMKVQRNVRPS